MNFIKDIFFSEVNIGITILLALLVAYWLFTIISGFDFDFDVDVDVDVDVDADVDVDSDATAAESVGIEDAANTEVRHEQLRKKGKLNWFQIFLIYFNFVGLPFMFTLTTWVLIWWTITVTGTYLTGTYDNQFGFVFFFGAIIPSLFIAKFVTTPFKSFFQKFNPKGDESLEIIGRVGKLLSKLEKDKIGSAELIIEGSPIKIYAQSLDGSVINPGDQILVIKQSNDKKHYLIQQYQD